MFRKFLLAAALALAANAASAATCYVTEFKGSPPTYVAYQAATQPAITTQAVTFTTTTQSAVFNAQTGLVRVQCDAICNVVFGTNPTATTTSMRLTAGQTEYFVVAAGTSLRLAVVAGS